MPVALDWNNLYLLTAAELDALERARGLRLDASPRALNALCYWDRPGSAAAFSWNAGVDVWAERVMQATATAAAAPPPMDDADAREAVDPAYAAALAGTLRAVFDHMAASATLRDSASLTIELRVGLALGVLLL